MFIEGISVGIGLLFISLLYLNTANQKPSKLVTGIILILSWLVSGSFMLEQGGMLARLYIASVPVVFFLLLPMIYWYQLQLTAYGSAPHTHKRAMHWLPVALAGLLSLSIGLMPTEDFNNMFFNDTEQLSHWVNINSFGFAFLLVGWTILSVIYLGSIVINTKAYHQQLNTEFADHEGKRLDWLVGFTGLLVVTWVYALIVLASTSATSTPLISETALSILMLLLIWLFCLQTLHRRPVFAHIEPVPAPKIEPEIEPEIVSKAESKAEQEPKPEKNTEQKYSNSSIDDERLKRIAKKIEGKVMGEKSYLNPDINASTLAKELGISVHYLSQAFSQQMQTTFYGYINDVRIEAAKDMLKTTEDTVLDIALSIGYNTRSSFYNAFKKRTGITPSKYKASANSVEPMN